MEAIYCPSCQSTDVTQVETLDHESHALCFKCGWQGINVQLHSRTLRKSEVTSVHLTAPSRPVPRKETVAQEIRELEPTPLELDMSLRDLLKLKEELDDEQSEASIL